MKLLPTSRVRMPLSWFFVICVSLSGFVDRCLSQELPASGSTQAGNLEKSTSTAGEKAVEGRSKVKPAGSEPEPMGKERGDLSNSKPETGFSKKTDAQWRAQLTKSEYWVTRQKGTEPAFSGKYAQGKHTGIFSCVGCGSELFSSKTKFESGTGWPSFWQPIRPEAVSTAPDFDGFEPRMEVICTRCDAHLGHVFEDGPPPTGLRYCMNSVALKLKPFPKVEPKPAKPGSGESQSKNRPNKVTQPTTDTSNDAINPFETGR